MKYRCLTTIFVFVLFGFQCFAQQNGLEALKKDYPQLMEKFGSELENQRADYYFLVDVSGTMQQYKEIVVPALQEFFRSMQTDDYVSVIKFGGAAKNDIGSQGKVSDGVIKNLINYVPNLYKVPDNASERELYYKFTDLHAMLQHLTAEMHMPGLNNLKFIFIITDFIHDPTAENKGKEDWAAIKRQLANEQSENHLYVFALQLPGKGAGQDLDKVKSAFPVPIELEEVQDKAALSEWFSHKKNRILLDKFTALIRNKHIDPQVEMKPEFTKDGYLTLQTSWKSNELFQQLSVDDVILENPDFKFKSYLPVVLDTKHDNLQAGKIVYKSVSLPFFHTYGDSLTTQMSLVAPYTNELIKLGFEQQPVLHVIPVRSSVFTFYLPFWVTVAILILLILYVILAVRAFMRNRSGKVKINGTIIVRYQGDEVTRKKIMAQKKVDVGTGALGVAVAHDCCMWLIEIQSVTYSCLWLFKKPEYRVAMRKGKKFKANGREYLLVHKPRIARGNSIVIDDFSIRWTL